MDCMCDYERPEFYRNEVRNAKKRHRCDECGRTIDAGERYEYASVKWDGLFQTFKTCPRCLELKDWVTAHVPCACFGHGNLIEDAIETAREYFDVPGFLFGAYRRKILIKRNEKAK